MKVKVLSFLCGVALMCVAGWTNYGQKQDTARPVYEYKVVVVPHSSMSEQMLNELGAQGWELTSVSSQVVKGGTMNNHFFKRVK